MISLWIGSFSGQLSNRAHDSNPIRVGADAVCGASRGGMKFRAVSRTRHRKRGSRQLTRRPSWVQIWLRAMLIGARTVCSGAETLRNVLYTLTIGAIEDAYCEVDAYMEPSRLILFRRAALPDICVVCGSPARGNVLHKEFEQGGWLAHLPSILQVVYLVLGKRYLLDFPFCSTCTPDEFQLSPLQMHDDFAIFGNASKALLKSLPLLPPDLAEEMEGSWLRRLLQRLFG